MHLAVLVVGKRVLLKTVHHHLVGYDHVATLGLNNKLKNVEQLARVASAVSQYGVGLFQLYVSAAQLHVLSDGAVQQFEKVILVERLQNIQLTAREQRPYDFKRRILCRRTYKRNNAPLYRTEQRILLRLAETMDLVDKQNGRSRGEELSFLCPLYHVAHVFHAARHGTERVKRSLQLVGYYLRECRFPDSRRSP